MFLLDTNILSAIIGARPVPEVAAWITRQPSERLFTAAICQAEILSGIAVMPDGRRRAALESAARAMFTEDFEGRLLAFDGAAAVSYAELYAVRRQIGRPAGTVDLMIASVARVHGASVVTRDSGGFDGCGLTVINPWTAS